jgi:OmpA-OmpF porin, OOP family
MIARFVVLAAAFALAACAGGDAWDVSGARSLPAQGDPFQQALREEYLALAEFERGEFDWTDVAYYVRRANASRETVLAPTELAARVLPADRAPELAAARSRLAQAFEDGGREAEPAQAARAQASFECWMEQQEEGHQAADIAECRKRFESAIAAVEEAIRPPPLRSVVVLMPDDDGTVGRVNVQTAEGAQSLASPREAARLSKAPPRWRRPFELDSRTVDARFGRALAVPRELIRRYVLYFEENSVALTPESQALMPELIAVVGSAKRKKVVITGHADRFGSEARNNVIAFHRSLEIRDALIARGISAAEVAPDERGERAPAVPTADGVKEPANRRVVIDFE